MGGEEWGVRGRSHVLIASVLSTLTSHPLARRSSTGGGGQGGVLRKTVNEMMQEGRSLLLSGQGLIDRTNSRSTSLCACLV